MALSPAENHAGLRGHGLTPLKHLPSTMGKDQSGLRRRSLSTDAKTKTWGKEWSPKAIRRMSDSWTSWVLGQGPFSSTWNITSDGFSKGMNGWPGTPGKSSGQMVFLTGWSQDRWANHNKCVTIWGPVWESGNSLYRGCQSLVSKRKRGDKGIWGATNWDHKKEISECKYALSQGCCRAVFRVGISACHCPCCWRGSCAGTTPVLLEASKGSNGKLLHAAQSRLRLNYPIFWIHRHYQLVRCTILFMRFRGEKPVLQEMYTFILRHSATSDMWKWGKSIFPKN